MTMSAAASASCGLWQWFGSGSSLFMFLFTCLLPSLMLSLPLSTNDPIYLISTRDPSALTSHLASLQSALNSQIEITNIYSNLAIHQDLPSLPHYAARLSPDALAYLRQHHSHEIAYIEQDQIYSIIKETTTAEPAPPSQDQCITQENPEWGLSRINQRGEFEYGTYAYDTRYAGAGVNIYIVDTGIYCENDDFVEKVAGTCTYGIDVIDGSNIDGNGHGTHCAGTAAGHKYGVAKEANLIAVRVLNNIGSGSTSGIIDGINWMVGHAQTSGNSSVANLSLGGSLSPALNSATAAAVLAGISMIVAAGNDNRDACNYSPASTDTAVTVGATDDKDNRADYSNYGPCLDIFGPGSSIKSAYIGSPSATATLSGTSMATPHIAGIAAVYQSIYNSSLTPTQVTEIILSQATANVLKDVNGTRPIGEDESPNLMGYVYTCNGTNSEDDHGIFGTTKSAFRALSVIFLCFSGFELGISIPSLYTSDDIFVLTYRTGIITLLMQCVLLPAVTLCIIEFGQFHKEYALSMIFVSIAPSGVISSVVSNYSKLNTHLAGVLSFFSNIISLLTVPLLCYIWIVRLWKLDEDTANISWNRFLAALVMMTLLTATGITIRAYCGKFFSKFLDVLISAGNALLFTIIMILGVSIYRDDISHASHTLWAVALLLQLFGGVSGWILSYILRVPFLDRLTVSIDTAGRGFILAISLLSFAFHSEKKEDLIVYPLIFGIVALVNLFWVIPFYRFISWFFIRSQRQETPGSDGVIFVESTLIGPSNPVSSAPPERNYSLQRTGGTPSPLVMNYANEDLNKALVVGGDGREYVY